MKRKTFLFSIIALFLLTAGAGCEKEVNSEYEIIATGTLTYDPTATVMCSPRTHILRRDNDELELVIIFDGKAIRTYDNAVVTIYGNRVKQINNNIYKCPDVIEVKKISKN